MESIKMFLICMIALLIFILFHKPICDAIPEGIFQSAVALLTYESRAD